MWTVRVTVDCLLLLFYASRTGLRLASFPLLTGMILIIVAGLCSGPILAGPWRAVICAVAAVAGLGIGWLQFLSSQDRNGVWRRPDRQVNNQISP